MPTPSHSYSLHKVVNTPVFVNISEHISFIFHSQKSISTQYKSIFPLTSGKMQCYNTPTLQGTQCISASGRQKTFIYIFCAEPPACPASSVRTDLRRFLFYERIYKRADPAVHRRIRRTAQTHQPLMYGSHDLIIWRYFYMKFQDNLMNAIDNYGQMLMRANYPGNVFLFRG